MCAAETDGQVVLRTQRLCRMTSRPHVTTVNQPIIIGVREPGVGSEPLLFAIHETVHIEVLVTVTNTIVVRVTVPRVRVADVLVNGIEIVVG